MKPVFLRVLSTAIFAALLLAAALPVSALADEGTPPPPTEETAPPADGDGGEPAPEEAAASEEAASDVVEEPAASEEVASEPAVEAAPGDEITSESALAPTEEVVSDSVAEPAPSEDLADALADIPYGTEIIVVNEAGEPLSLASEEAADVLATGDPIWCPAGVTPPLLGGGVCSPPFGSLAALEAWLYANDPFITVNGVIWIEKTYAAASGLDLDGDFLPNMSTKTLTIKGGWNGLGTATVDMADPSEVYDYIWVYNWANDVTLSDIIIDSTDNMGLIIDTSGKITLTRVESNNNDGDGAYLYNDYDNAKDVVITDSVFSDNGNNSSWGGNGLTVYSDGIITLTNVTASGNLMSDWIYDGADWVANDGNGAELNNWDGNGIVVNNSTFESNEGNGLVAASSKGITLNDVTANYNIQSWYHDVGPDIWYSHGGEGANITSDTSITLKDFTAIGNGSYGAYLNTWWAPILAPITLNGINVFGENGADGLSIWSWGAIKLNNIIANANGWTGAAVNNCWWDAGACTETQPITLTGSSEFKFNGDGGLFAYSGGAITLNNITATNNFNWQGAWLENYDSPLVAGPGITLTGANLFTDNGASGLEVHSAGVITLSNLTARWNGFVNGGDGAHLDNTYATLAKAVTLTGVNTFEGNDDDGLEILSRGAINVASLTANSNDDYGAWLDNSASGSPLAVNVTGKAEFQWNGSSGLLIYSKGAITVNNIYSNDNVNWGAYLINDPGWFPGAVGGVTVTGTATFTTSGGGFFENDWTGLVVYSSGVVTLTDLDFINNGGDGLYVNNTSGAAANVTVGTTLSPWCSGAQDNGWSGMEIHSNGAVTMNRICNTGNGYYGAWIDNSTASAPKAVTFTGLARFNGNGFDGLHVRSDGAITTMNLTAWDNGWSTAGVNINGVYVDGFGVYLDNLGNSLAPQNVTLNGFVDVENNYYSGIEVWTYGAILANNVYADSNGWGEVIDGDQYGYGAFFDNDNGTLSRPVTLNGTNEFFSNWTGGLSVTSLGAIKVNNLDAWNNEINGASLWNGGGVGGITISGHGWVSENYNDGLYAASTGAIALANADAWNNGRYGVLLDNTFSGDTTPQNVTITGNNSFWDNDASGLEVYSYGMISATNLDAGNNGWGSGGDGVYLDNNDGFLPRSVVVSTNDNFQWNEGYGLYVESLGAITVSNLFAEGNDLDGVYLSNIFAGAVGGITLNGTNEFWGNTGNGLTAYSYGAIKANNLSAWGNGGDGVHLDNDWPASTTGATVTLTGFNDFGNNGGDGLYILSWRAVTLSNLESYGNEARGVYINNLDAGTVSPQNVTISGTNEFDDNWLEGLLVNSYGIVTLSNLTARNNGWDDGRDGVLIDNCQLDGFGDCLATLPKPVTLSGTNTFNSNARLGLNILSLGKISANNLTANWNDMIGAVLDNWWDPQPPTGPLAGNGVTLTGTNLFEGNGNDGLRVYSHGAITMNNVTARWNTGDGTWLENEATTGPQVNVTLTGTNTFYGNGNWVDNTSWGLYVKSEGNITISNLTANWNDLGGAYLDNQDYGYLTPTVTLTGANNFLGNQFDGLKIYAVGAVSLSKVTADANGSEGVELYSEVGTVTITCGSITSNGGFGLYLDAGSTITLKGVYALGNGINTWFSPFPPIVVRSC